MMVFKSTFRKMSWNHRLLAILVLLVSMASAFAKGEGADLMCDPCIERPDYTVKVIVHGTTDDRFWTRVLLASEQAAKDMRIQLDFDLYDPDVFNFELMANDIVGTVTSESPPDALVVTIPSPEVLEAVKEVAAFIPIFGMNSGYELAPAAGVLDFFAMDEREGGELAGREFQKLSSNITRALFVNHAKGNNAVENRLIGFTEGLNSDTSVDELVVDVSSPEEAIKAIELALEGCEYNVVLLAGSQATLELALEPIQKYLDSGILLGSFDVGAVAYSEIAEGRLSFTIAQQEHLQGTLSVVAAAIYATTEKKLSRSDAPFGTHLTGPAIINIGNLPSDELQACAEDAFPVCLRTTALDATTESACSCLDRSKIRIAGVVHGTTTDTFWDIVFAQANQAASDLGVELILDRLEPQEDEEILFREMATQISSLCNDRIDGIFISFPSEILSESVRECQELNIPVISINSGASFSEQLDLLHFIGQLEYDAGFMAGERMAQEGATAGVCIIHMDGNEALVERCSGFENGFTAGSAGSAYLGSPIVALDEYKVEVTEFIDSNINSPGDWNEIAALSLGPDPLPYLLELGLFVGTFDTNQEIFDELDSGNLLFGIDQNPFMQGYLPVWLLTTVVHSEQSLQNTFIQTGPSFVEDAPSNALEICIANDFRVCGAPDGEVEAAAVSAGRSLLLFLVPFLLILL